MKKDSSQINYIFTRFLAPFLLCFTFYIQLFGEMAPGGGFQAGALLASLAIALNVSSNYITKYLSTNTLLKFATIGFLLYFLTGNISLFFGDNFLNYYSISSHNGQSIGIMLIELGVGICVSSVMLIIYLEFLNAS